jgi:hypothetical protein
MITPTEQDQREAGAVLAKLGLLGYDLEAGVDALAIVSHALATAREAGRGDPSTRAQGRERETQQIVQRQIQQRQREAENARDDEELER